MHTKEKKINTVLRQLSTESSSTQAELLQLLLGERAFSSKAAPQTRLSLGGKGRKWEKKFLNWKKKIAERHCSCGETPNWVLTIFQGQSCEVSNDNCNLPLANWPSRCTLCPPAMQPCCRMGLLAPLAEELESCLCHEGTCSHWVLSGSSKCQELFLLPGALLRSHFA